MSDEMSIPRRAFGLLWKLAAVTIWFGVIVTVGPAVELWLAPPLRMDLTTVGRDGNTLSFAMEGEKTRDCPIISLSTTWVYEDTAMPATLIRPPDEPGGVPVVGEQPRILYAVGDRFFRYPFRVNVPNSFVEGSTYLRVTSTYRCHIFWTLPVVDIITAEMIPPRAPSP